MGILPFDYVYKMMMREMEILTSRETILFTLFSYLYLH